MTALVLAILSLNSGDLLPRVQEQVMCHTLLFCAKLGVGPEQLCRIAWPDRCKQDPDERMAGPNGYILSFWWDRYRVQVVWKFRRVAGRPPVRVLQSAGRR
jgi:hypothetical protein